MRSLGVSQRRVLESIARVEVRRNSQSGRPLDKVRYYLDGKRCDHEIYGLINAKKLSIDAVNGRLASV